MHVLSLLFLAWYGEAVELAVVCPLVFFLKHPLVIQLKTGIYLKHSLKEFKLLFNHKSYDGGLYKLK